MRGCRPTNFTTGFLICIKEANSYNYNFKENVLATEYDNKYLSFLNYVNKNAKGTFMR